jgi:hypothetical protein
LDEEPILFSHLSWVWEGFSELNYRRGVSMSGPVPITMTDIEAYCRYRQIYTPVERDRFLLYLRALDQDWMANFYDESKKKQDTPENFTDRPSFNRPQ